MLKRAAAGFFSDRCTRVSAGIFGTILLMAVLFVPCTRTSIVERPDVSGRLRYRITIPRKAYVFLPTYLGLKAREGTGTATVRISRLQWFATIVFVILTGIADTLLFCSWFRRKRAPPRDPEGEGTSGFSLLR